MVTDVPPENQELLLSHKLRNRANRLHSWLCVGLDPEAGKLPEGISRDARGVEKFCRALIDATLDYAAVFKPNVAFFEALGPDGWAVLARVRAAIPTDVPVIADAKRGDVGNSARAYATAFFESLGFDAMTVNPYLGPESIAPYMHYPSRCVFVLCKTSNPMASLVQDIRTQSGPLYLDVARWASALEGPAEIGLVVGATQPEAVKSIREQFPKALLLLPGVGAQGAPARPTMELGADTRGGNALPSVSRQILYASSDQDFAEAARVAARDFAAETWLDRSEHSAGR